MKNDECKKNGGGKPPPYNIIIKINIKGI